MSSSGFPYFRSQVAAELDAIHHRWGWILAWGVLLVIVGMAALMYPVAATIVSVQIFGFVLLLGAVGQFIAAFSARGWGGVLASVLCGVLYLFAGIVLLDRPLLGAAGYTLFLAMMFFAIGIVRIVAAVLHRFSGWGWAL